VTATSSCNAAMQIHISLHKPNTAVRAQDLRTWYLTQQRATTTSWHSNRTQWAKLHGQMKGYGEWFKINPCCHATANRVQLIPEYDCQYCAFHYFWNTYRAATLAVAKQICHVIMNAQRPRPGNFMISHLHNLAVSCTDWGVPWATLILSHSEGGTTPLLYRLAERQSAMMAIPGRQYSCGRIILKQCPELLTVPIVQRHPPL